MSDLEPRQQQIFSVFLEAPPRRRWPLAAVLAGVVLTAVSFRVAASYPGTNVVTPYGIRTIERGMTEHQVNDLLGKPLALATSFGGMDCFRYGYPNLESPSFVVYSLCYQQARLREISQQRFSAWTVDEEGTLAPPPASP